MMSLSFLRVYTVLDCSFVRLDRFFPLSFFRRLCVCLSSYLYCVSLASMELDAGGGLQYLFLTLSSFI